MAKKKAQNGDKLATQKKFFKDYLNSPKYKQRLTKQGYTNQDQVIKDRLSNVSSTTELPLDISTFYDLGSNSVIMDNAFNKQNNIPTETARAHELSHAAGSLVVGRKDKSKNLLLNQNDLLQLSRRNSAIDEHDKKPHELKADLDTLRYYLQKDKIYDTNNQDFTPEFLKKSKDKYKSDPAINRLFKNVKDTDLIYLMNNIAQNQDNSSDMAKYGKKKAQNGKKVPKIIPQSTGDLRSNAGIPSSKQLQLNAEKEYAGLPLYKDFKNTKALRKLNEQNHWQNDSTWTDVDTIGYLAYRKLLGENKAPNINFDPNIKRSNYTELNNTMNINSRDAILAEAAHAQQAKSRLLAPKVLWDKARYFGSEERYNDPTTLEYEAHSIIEPKLKSRYLDMTLGISSDYVGKDPYEDDNETMKKYALPMKKKNGGKAQNGEKFSPGTFPPDGIQYLPGWKLPGHENYMKKIQPPDINIPDPMKELQRIQNMQIPALPTQDYGVKATDPTAGLTAGLGVYNKKKKNQNPTNWGDVATGALLLTDALLPADPTYNPVVRPQVGYNPHPYGTGSQAIAKSGLKISNTGYKSTSKDKNKPGLRIPSNQITMKGVPHPVIGVSNTGDTQFMIPGQEYSFDGNYVDETPVKAQNGQRMTPEQIDYFNNFNAFVEKKGLKGSPKLNNQQFARSVYAEYQQNAPNDLTYDQLIPMAQSEQYVQKDFDTQFAQRRNPALADTIAKGSITPSDGLYGPLTSSRNIPRASLQTFNNNKLIQNKDLGYVPESLNSGKVAKSKLPPGVQLEESVDSDGIKTKGYTDPKSGDWVPVEKLRQGGRLYNRAMYADGGSLTPISEDTSLINGPSHSNGGVDLMYGKNGVEVEGGETAFKSQDGSLNIMGNMINPLTGRKFKEDSKRLAKKEQKIDKLLDYSVGLVNEADIKDKWDILKFNSGKVQMEGAFKKKAELKDSKEHLSTIQNAMLEYSQENNLDPAAFSKGQFKAMKPEDKAQNGWKFQGTNTLGLDSKIKEFVSLLDRKGFTGRSGKESGVSQRNTKSGRPSRHASGEALDAFLDTPDAYNKVLGDPELTKFLVDNGLTVLNEYDPNVAKKTGATAGHLHIGYDKGTSVADKFRQDAAATYKQSNPNWGWGTHRDPKGRTIPGGPAGDQQDFGETVGPTTYNPNMPTFPGQRKAGTVNPIDYGFDIKNPNQYQKPSDAKGLSFTQILPELYTAATNRVEPVFMQEYNPQLFQDYNVSFQDRLNENQASYSAMSKGLTRGRNTDPSVLATLAGQKYGADSGVLADEFRTNQAIEQDVTNKNIALLNDAELKNLQLADQQYVRQSTAKSKTKQQNQIVLQSIADKIHQNALEQRTLKVYENLYPNYSFGKDYRTDFTGENAGDAISWTPSYKPLQQDAATTVKTDAKGNITTTKQYPSTVQQQLQNIDLSTKTLKYNDYFLNQSRRIAKNFNKKP